MISVFKKTACLLCAAAAAFAFGGCGKTEEPAIPTSTEIYTLPTAPALEETIAETDPRELVEELTVVLEAGEIYTLEYYPNLKSVDLSGSTCYDTIVHYMEKHPEVAVTYSVDFGGTTVPHNATEATLKPGKFTYESLLENLQYLPSVTKVNLPDVQLTGEQITTLEEAYPGIALEYTVSLLGSTYDSTVTELDLSAMTSAQVSEATSRLALLTSLTSVTLSDSLSFSDVAALQKACPDILFDYSFSLFGKTVSTADAEIIYKNQSIGDDKEAQLREALDLLVHCQRFVLDNCDFTNETLAKVREDYRGQTKVVWRVYFGVNSRYNTLTDDDVIRCVKNITDSTCEPMKYLEDVVHADLGHNDTLSDLSFVGYWTKLETLIASGCAVSDLSGFENCKNLLWLELAYCGKLKDISPLAGCENLAYLNLSFTGVSDYMPLDTLPLERFVCLSPKGSKAERETFSSIHPKEKCLTVFYGQSNPYSYGWRYDDNGKTMFWYYKDIIREVFNYDQADAILDAQKKANGG